MLGEQRIGREACRALSLFFCVVLVPVAAPEDVEREVAFSVHISPLTVLAYLHPAVAVYLHVLLPVLRVEVVHVIVKAEKTVPSRDTQKSFDTYPSRGRARLSGSEMGQGG